MWNKRRSTRTWFLSLCAVANARSAFFGQRVARRWNQKFQFTFKMANLATIAHHETNASNARNAKCSQSTVCAHVQPFGGCTIEWKIETFAKWFHSIFATRWSVLVIALYEKWEFSTLLNESRSVRANRREIKRSKHRVEDVSSLLHGIPCRQPRRRRRRQWPHFTACTVSSTETMISVHAMHHRCVESCEALLARIHPFGRCVNVRIRIHRMQFFVEACHSVW